jgi:hypothetical protein
MTRPRTPSRAPRGIATATAMVVALCALPRCASLQGTPGSACSSPSDCQSGTKCLYAIGAGCDAGGHCGVASSQCLPGAAGLVLCGCGGIPVDLSCISNSAVLEQPTATGEACSPSVDGGSDAPADGG